MDAFFLYILEVSIELFRLLLMRILLPGINTQERNFDNVHLFCHGNVLSAKVLTVI